MTKWDTIQSDLDPVTPKYWGDEHEFDKEFDLDDEEFSLDNWEEM
jgi:hypothetical protein